MSVQLQVEVAVQVYVQVIMQVFLSVQVQVHMQLQVKVQVQMIFPSVTEHRLRGQDQFAQNATSLSVQLLKKVDPIAA